MVAVVLLLLMMMMMTTTVAAMTVMKLCSLIFIEVVLLLRLNDGITCICYYSKQNNCSKGINVPIAEKIAVSTPKTTDTGENLFPFQFSASI